MSSYRPAIGSSDFLNENPTASTGHRFEFQKRHQLFIRAHKEPLSVVAMRVCNPHRSPFGINGSDAAQTPTGFAEIVSDDFPVFHHDAMIRVYDEAANVIETHEHTDEFKEW